jgi:oligoendopeptidase F
MAPELEDLAADLDTTGLSAWSRLYDRVSGTLEFELAVPGREPRRVPVALVRSLLEDAAPAVRRAALLGSNAAWERVGDVAASCLNAISGTRLLLYRRQGVPHFLDPALFDSAISRRTLDALLDAVRGRGELARAYLHRKAQILFGTRTLGFQDLLAPLPLEGLGRVPWPEARERVLRAFARFHPELESFARRAFDGRWIDWEPRPGKRPGGFCSSSPVIRESRVFLTYGGAPGDVSTLAHELGHAFHAFAMRDLRPFALRYPMTLAETASTFAERLLADARLAEPGLPAAERLALLDGRMQDAATFLLNIPMRLHFETALYEERARGELSPRRLGELMREAQRAWYGDTIAEEELDPWFWASKLHFYIAGLSFYNFPYTFGFLFSLGLYARAREQGSAFLPRYVELLRRTGRMSAEDVARSSLGVDLGEPVFWNASLDLVAEDARAFEEAAAVCWPLSD